MAADALPILARVETHTRRRRLAWSTAVFSLFTGLSRILGLVREVVARGYFGVNGPINAFDVAFLIPNTIRALVADAALSGAFVPVFSDLLDRGERARAWRVASSLLWLVLLFLTGITAFFVLIAPWIMHAFGYGAFATSLARLLFPIVVLLGVFGILVGVLNSYDEFAIPALSPVVWNVAIIVGLVIGVPRADGIEAKLYVYAASILVATVIQTLLPLPWLRGRDGRLHMVLDWRDPAVRRVFVLMLPISIGLGLININAVIDTFFASRFIDRYQAPSAINAAFRLYMLPQGMFSVAVATVLFPTLTRLASRNDIPAFRNTVNAGLRQIAFLLDPGQHLHGRARRADRPPRLRARQVHVRADPRRRRRARRLRARPHVQRLHAHAEPRLLQPADPVAADLRRAREPRPQRGSRRRVLPPRRLGASAVDRDREHRRDGRAAGALAPPVGRSRPQSQRIGASSAS